ncbi:MAG TPA: response regulator [Candidatus Binatia bacterium]|nr:response regulator [Candidatus Binatia bacterium]
MARGMLLATIMIRRAKPATRPTVLVVDDESGPREAFRLVLEDAFNVLTADSGWAALDALRKNAVDVITLDLTMPAISGIDTLKRIRKIDSDVEVVIVSALPAPNATSECKRLRASEVLAKPSSRTEILSVAERAAARRIARRRATEAGGIASQVEQSSEPRHRVGHSPRNAENPAVGAGPERPSRPSSRPGRIS